MTTHQKILILLQAVVAGVVLFFVFHLVEWRNVLTAIHHALPAFLIGALLLVPCNLGVRIIKWHFMLKRIDGNVLYFHSMKSLLLGISLGAFTPGELGDMLGRAWHIPDVRKSHIVGLALLDRMQFLGTITTFGVWSILFLLFPFSLFNILTTLVVCFVAVSFLLFLGKLATLTHAKFTKLWLTLHLDGVLEGMGLFSPSEIVSLVSFTVIHQFVIVLQMFFLLNAFTRVSLLTAFLGTSGTLFIQSVLPISLGDLGVREMSSMYFFSLCSVPREFALMATLLLFVMNIVVPGMVGILIARPVKFLKRTSENNV
ncbi:MAG TPA: lysylphosphatidylglycerol synthase transmembrane domain-containing protein [Bacteroidota bacterium]|nr:lysylphosphatidylglycerol synthase transmembrane domain-containing protein [Bacteroidota bacterium]